MVHGFNAAPDRYRLSLEVKGTAIADDTPSRPRSIEELPIALGFIPRNAGALRPSVQDGVNSGRDTDSIGATAAAPCRGCNPTAQP